MDNRSLVLTATLLTALSAANPALAGDVTSQPYACGLEYFAPQVVEAFSEGNAPGYVIPRETGTIRFASFNANLAESGPGVLAERLATPDYAKARVIAEIIQRTDADVILLNEFDFDATGEAIRSFQRNYLSISQNGAPPIDYPYVFLAESNTGLPANIGASERGCSPECDFDNDGNFGVLDAAGFMTDPDDAYGFGFYPGQFAMVLLSKHPIDQRRARTFQRFLWKDMPRARLPSDPSTGGLGDWYSEAELEVFRLSSKSHWDVPVRIDGKTVHVLTSHPTPPVFDGPEDRNGLRNADEIRFWADYVGPRRHSRYIVDDRGKRGGLKPNRRFVIMGDQNADPFDGDSTDEAILQLLNHPAIDASLIPAAQGGADAAMRSGGANALHLGSPVADTGDFFDGSPGNLRADYVLPSRHGLEPRCAGVFWPRQGDAFFELVGDFPFPGSDHRLVWMDLVLEKTGRRDD
jgi:hypothetical protein